MSLKGGDKRRWIKAFLIIAFSCTMLVVFIYPVSANSRAVLLSPRLGSGIQGPRTAGAGNNKTNYLNGTLSIYVGPDPAESPVPLDWYRKNLWSIALTPSVMPTAECIVLKVVKIRSAVSSFSAFGGGLGQNPIIPSAVQIVCEIPADIEPLTYDLAVGFNVEITPAKQLSGDINLTVEPGSWQGNKGSAYRLPFSGVDSFLLKEASCVSIPWINDAHSSDKLSNLQYNGNPVKPFTFLHLSDTHFKNDRLDWLTNNELWENDSQVLAPDFIAISGDLIEGAHEDPTEMLLAYQRMRNLGIPLIITLGNHDHKVSSLWRHYIGPLYSNFRFDDVSVISFDSTLPIGSGVLNWMDNQAKSAISHGPSFLMCHYPPYNNYFTGGWQGTADIMVENNLSGILTGHTHTDFMAEMSKIRDRVLESDSLFDFEYIFDDFNDNKKHLKAISEPIMFVTRTAAKNGWLRYNYTLPSFAGYREFTVVDNKVYNFTYDYTGNGVRDAQVSIPVGRFTTNLQFTGSNWQWHLENDYNHRLNAGRAIFKVPNPSAGMKWDLISLNKTNGAYIRTYISNSTTTYIDARVSIPANTNIILEIEEVPEAG